MSLNTDGSPVVAEGKITLEKRKMEEGGKGGDMRKKEEMHIN